MIASTFLLLVAMMGQQGFSLPCPRHDADYCKGWALGRAYGCNIMGGKVVGDDCQIPAPAHPERKPAAPIWNSAHSHPNPPDKDEPRMSDPHAENMQWLGEWIETHCRIEDSKWCIENNKADPPQCVRWLLVIRCDKADTH